MTGREFARTVAAYTAAGTLTAVAAFVAAIPVPDTAVSAVTIDATVLVGWPVLCAADRIRTRKEPRP